MMGTIYEELIRKTSEAGNEEAGEHFTPREVIKLIVNLLFSPDKELLKQKYLIRTIYDPAAGTGGMLSIASEYVSTLNPDIRLDMFGQEMNPESYAICKSDMMLKGLDLNNIKPGNSLIQSNKEEDILGDGFPSEKFHYMLSNPPFGVDWKKYESEIRLEAENGFKGKYGPGLPRRSDGSLLFLLHMISKMKSVEQGGSRIAIVLNSSPLFTGEANSGESDIRKFIIENDMLEAIIALPDQLFYNTGISTYLWIVTNNKEPRRKGKVHLINAVSFYEKMRISLGEKRNYLTDEQIIAITKIYEDFEENKYSKVFENREFGYTRITVERPLKRNFQVTEERLARLKQESVLQIFARSKIKLKQDDIIAILKTINSAELFRDYKEFSKVVKNAFSQAKFMLSPQLENTIFAALSERDEAAQSALDKYGKPIPDSALRDYENVPLKEDIDKYFEYEVRPYVPDAWIDNSTRKKIGYEIPITKIFYEYKPLRSVEEIATDIRQLESEISDGLKEMIL
jgi:type I restriction enzyme M protein